MRVVIDTNVFISSFFGSIPRKIIDQWKNGRITLCLTRPIMEEYLDVLYRMELGEQQGVGDLLGILKKQTHCCFCAKTVNLEIYEDKDDDKFIEAAVSLKAQFIVSGDRHVKSVRKYGDIQILSPREFITCISLWHQE